jgi:hypothetical protein
MMISYREKGGTVMILERDEAAGAGSAVSDTVSAASSTTFVSAAAKATPVASTAIRAAKTVRNKDIGKILAQAPPRSNR